MSAMIAEDQGAPAVTEEFVDYRVMSRTAVLSAVLVLPAAVIALYTIGCGLGAEALPGVLPLPLVGVVLGLIGLLAIRRYPTEYAGKWLALIGLVFHPLVMAISLSTHLYVSATEVPEGYQPIGFSDLQPDPEKGEFGLPEKAIDLIGKRVFIKGYIHPGVASSGKVDHFILVRDFGTCCFGGQPEPTHMMEIKIVGGAPRPKYSTRMIRLAGTFAVTPPRSLQALEIQNVVYHLQADYVKH